MTYLKNIYNVLLLRSCLFLHRASKGNIRRIIQTGLLSEQSEPAGHGWLLSSKVRRTESVWARTKQQHPPDRVGQRGRKPMARHNPT